MVGVWICVYVWGLNCWWFHVCEIKCSLPSSLPFKVVPSSLEQGSILLATLIGVGEDHKHKIIGKSVQPKIISYRCTVSQVFLQLVVAPGNLDELLIGRYKVLEAKQCDVLREYGPSTGDVQKIDPTVVLVIHTCRRHSKQQTKSPSKLLLKIPLLSQRVTTTNRKDSISLALINVCVNRYITDWATGKSKNVWVSCDLTG